MTRRRPGMFICLPTLQTETKTGTTTNLHSRVKEPKGTRAIRGIKVLGRLRLLGRNLSLWIQAEKEREEDGPEDSDDGMGMEEEGLGWRMMISRIRWISI